MSTAFNVILIAVNPSTESVVAGMLDEAPTGSSTAYSLDLTVHSDLATAEQALEQRIFDVVILEVDSARGSNLTKVTELVDANPDIPMLFLADRENESIAWQAADRFSFDYVLMDEMKPRWLRQAIVATARLAVARAEIERLGDDLQHAEEQVREAYQSEARFLSEMSHEIRTPMNSVVGITDLLRRSPLNRDQQKFVDIIQNSAKVLLDVINDILTFSKMEKGKFVLQIQVFDLRKIVEGVAQILAEKACEKGVYLSTYVSPSIPALVTGDPQRLRQVFLQLTSNAIKYSGANKVQLRVELSPNKSLNSDVLTLRGSVHDTGCGIAPEIASALFDSSAQALRIKQSRTSHTGFGLIICKKIVESMNGEISVNSAVGKGSTFTFDIDLMKAPSSEDFEQDGRELRGCRLLFGNLPEAELETLIEYAQSLGIEYDVAESLERVLAQIDSRKKQGLSYHLVLLDLVQSKPEDIKTLISYLNERQQDLAVLKPLEEVPHVEKLFELQLAHELSTPIRQSQFISCLSNAIYLDGQSLEIEPYTRIEDELLRTGKFDMTQKILVVEDNQINREIVRLQLRSLGMQPYLVSSGARAVEVAAERHFHFILMDCQMPKMDGYQTTEKIRELQRTRSERSIIIALTANALQGARERCLAAGMDDFMSKPVTIEKLGHTLLKWQAKLGTDSDASFQSSAMHIQGRSREDARAATALKDADEQTLDLAFIRDNLVTTYGEESGQSIFELFCASTPELIEQLETAWALQDFTALKNKAHELKGQCSMVQADQLAALCKELEELIKSEERAMVDGVLRRLRTSYEQAKLAETASES
jgi:two-component system sensor histidine kinase/response regulator